MNIRNRIIENILKETSEGKCQKWFEDYLFGEFKKWHGKEIEKDTEIEDDIYNAVEKFIKGVYREKSKKDLVDKFEKLIRCKNKYDNILEPKPKVIYRGDIIRDDYVDHITNSNWSFEKSDKSFIKYRTKKIEFNPLSKVQSWTTNPKIALRFSNIPSSFISCVYISKKPNEKEIIFDPEFTNKFGYNEDEVVRVGDKMKCEAVIFVKLKKRTFDHYSEKDIRSIDPELPETIQKYKKDLT